MKKAIAVEDPCDGCAVLACCSKPCEKFESHCMEIIKQIKYKKPSELKHIDFEKRRRIKHTIAQHFHVKINLRHSDCCIVIDPCEEKVIFRGSKHDHESNWGL